MHKSCDSHVTCIDHHTYRIQCVFGDLQVHAEGIRNLTTEPVEVTKSEVNKIVKLMAARWHWSQH